MHGRAPGFGPNSEPPIADIGASLGFEVTNSERAVKIHPDEATAETGIGRMLSSTKTTSFRSQSSR
jgi:hypothetical protein